MCVFTQYWQQSKHGHTVTQPLQLLSPITSKTHIHTCMHASIGIPDCMHAVSVCSFASRWLFDARSVSQDRVYDDAAFGIVESVAEGYNGKQYITTFCAH